MSDNKKPAVLVAIVLSALIVVPILVLMVLRADGTPPQGPLPAGPSAAERGAVSADFELRQLADKAEAMLSGELAAALRQGDVSLDFAAAVNRDADKARRALSAGKHAAAREAYLGVLQALETQFAILSAADKARSLNETSYAELQRLEHLKSSFENTYRDAVQSYNQALRDLDASQFVDSVSGFERTGTILAELESRAQQQVEGLMEAAHAGLQKYHLSAARTAYESVLQLHPGHAAATEGLRMVVALEGVAEEVQAIEALAAAGDLEAALVRVDACLAQHANNSILLKLRQELAAQILERDRQAALDAAATAEAAGDWPAAIASLQAANALRASAEVSARLKKLQAQVLAARLEALLASGYDALQAGRYAAARSTYQAALDLAPASTEARTGLEKASSLYLAHIRYSQNVANAAKYLKQGRFPLAAQFFNDAMRSRPSQLPPSEAAEEARIRAALAQQSSEVAVTIASDKRTYVSLIGVFPPDRFKQKELSLFPDVYKLKGTRKGYQDVVIELKVDARQTSHTFEVICTEKI